MQFIFDTNYYRTVFHKLNDEIKFENQIQFERLMNYKILFPNIVALELLNHFNDETQTSEICYNSLKLLNKHCYTENEKMSIIPTFNELITYHIFQKKSEFKDFNMNIFHLSQNCNILNLNEFKYKFKKELNEVEYYKNREIEIIIENIKTFYISKLSENTEANWYILQENKKLNIEFRELVKNGDIHKIIGLGFIRLAMDQVHTSDIPFDKEHFENVFLNEFRVSIDFYIQNILMKLVEMTNLERFYNPKSDKKKRWNSYYDMQLIFATEFENNRNLPTKFVTSEKKIIESFRKNDKSEYVIHVDDYERLIK